MTSRVDDVILAKMIVIAARLNARVIGDDGEHYVKLGDEPIPGA